MFPFVLTKIFFKRHLQQMIFHFLFKEDYIAKRTWWLESKELCMVLLPAKYKLVIVVNFCQATPYPAAHQANGLWQVGSCPVLPNQEAVRYTACPWSSTFCGSSDVQETSFQSLNCPRNKLQIAPTYSHSQIFEDIVKSFSR